MSTTVVWVRFGKGSDYEKLMTFTANDRNASSRNAALQYCRAVLAEELFNRDDWIVLPKGRTPAANSGKELK